MKIINFLKREWVVIVITVLPIVIIGFKWGHIVEKLNTENLPLSDLSEILIFVSLNIILYPFILLYPRTIFIGKYKESVNKILMTTRMIIHSALSFFTLIILFEFLDYPFTREKISIAVILCFFLVAGNYFGNIRQNHFIGIRLPWILANEKIWNMTHRLLAKLLMAASCLGLVFLGTNLFINLKLNANFFYFGPIALALLISVIYSYYLHRKIHK